MPLRVQCHYCRNTIKIADQLRGRAIRCPYCQQATKVPAARSSMQAGSMPAPVQPVMPMEYPAAPLLPDRTTRMPPPRTHFEGVDVPDHVYQEPVVEEVDLEILRPGPSAPQGIDSPDVEPIEEHEEEIPRPLRSRKKKSNAMLWVVVLLAVLLGAAVGVIGYLNGWFVAAR